MSTTKKRTATPEAYDPPVYDPAAGKRSLDALAPALDVIPETDLITLRVDVEAATYASLGVAGFIASPDIHARFARLPEDELDPAHIDGLTPACFATLYALAEARTAGALETAARLPSDVVAEASEVEARMQTLCEYHFGDDPAIKPELDRLRPGNGHRDLANDLLGYARLYDLHPEVVKADPKHYRPGDAARARELGGTIIQALSASMTPRARVAYDRYARAWTLLNRRYDEVRAAGLWLFRKDPLRDQRFPSLFAAARPNVGRPKKQEAGASGDIGPGGAAQPVA